MTTLNRFEAAALLGIGERTLRRRVEKGLIQCSRVGTGKFAEVSFTYEQLGLPEPAPVVVPEPAVEVAITPCNGHPAPVVDLPLHGVMANAPRPASPIDSKAEADLRFAQAYLAGEVTDSAGNDVNGVNRRFPTKGIQTLLGPVEPQKPKRVSGDAHMHPQMRARRLMIGTDGEPVEHAGSDNHPLNRDANKERKVLTEGQTKKLVDEAVFLAALRQGFVR